LERVEVDEQRGQQERRDQHGQYAARADQHLVARGHWASPCGTLAHRRRAGHTEIGSDAMADVLNLRRLRKEKARREQERAAEANRLRFGRTKAQKRADQDAKRRTERAAEDKKLDK